MVDRNSVLNMMLKTMFNKLDSKPIRLAMILLLCMGNSACVGTVVGAVVDTTIEVVKVPFKVGAAVIDVATDDDSDFTSASNLDQTELSTEAGAVKMENSETQ